MKTSIGLQLPPRIARMSRWVAALCWAAALAWPFLALVAALELSPADLLQRAGGAGGGPEIWGGDRYADWQRALVLAVLTIPPALSGWAMACLGWGFRALAGGDAHFLRAHAALRGFAGWTVVATLAAVLAGMAASVLLTLHHAPGQRQLALGISSSQVQAMLMAALVWVFAHLLLRARAVADENEQFV